MASVVYMVVIFTIHESRIFRRGDVMSFIVTDMIAAAFVAGYWTLIWRKPVRWTQKRIKLTLLAAVLAIIIAVCIGSMMSFVDDTFGAFIGGATAILLWLMFTVFIWRESKEERAARISISELQVVVCPDCGYNLTGLRQTTYPECGSSYTINELLASQPGRESIEIEH
ncbi:MAG: hypothetical protein IH984_12005 [Planctomycetes bacterium]|nr:hypothetical protein [Planctomycetota bacterium]